MLLFILPHISWEVSQGGRETADPFRQYKVTQVPTKRSSQHRVIMRLSLTLIYLSLAAIAQAAQPTTVVDLGYAKYQGGLNNQTGNVDFLGMRYAAAPTGGVVY